MVMANLDSINLLDEMKCPVYKEIGKSSNVKAKIFGIFLC